MTSIFSASLKQASSGALAVEFRHPVRSDPFNQGKPGRKVRKGLGKDRAAAEQVIDQLNRLLGDASLHTPTARARAEREFDPRVIEIFYEGMEVASTGHRIRRDEALPLPPRNEAPRILLLGPPGAGKTTLVRQLIGTHPEKDRFPAASVNRTTTSETEIIVGGEAYKAVATFMSEEEAQFEVRECVDAALARAIEQAPDADVARALLERSDMRFRLKYILGGWPVDQEIEDPYETESDQEDVEPNVLPFDLASPDVLAERLRGLVAKIRELADQLRATFDLGSGRLEELGAEDRNNAIDELQTQAESSPLRDELVDDILDAIRECFEASQSGRLIKSTTGWPRLWSLEKPPTERVAFLNDLRRFTGNDRKLWGGLLTPLVSGVRVAGPFSPSWSPAGKVNAKPRYVLMDTEGLGHKAGTVPDVPDHIVSRFSDSDMLVLVHKADVPFTFEGGKALESIGGSGQTAKTLIAFTRMEAVEGDNIAGWKEKQEFVFSGLRNVIENQVSKALSPEIGRYMLGHFEGASFFLGTLQRADPKASKPELLRLLERLETILPPPPPSVAFPEYNFDLLILALQKGIEGFRKPWRAYLNLDKHNDLRPLHWQSIKAVSRRYAEGFDDGYEIRPASQLLNTMTLAVSAYLEAPLRWSGETTAEDKRAVLDQIKEVVSKKLTAFCIAQLRQKPIADWQGAYALSGTGSTFRRRTRIEELFSRWVPIPTDYDDKNVEEFVTEATTLVRTAIEQTKTTLAATVQ